MTVVRTLAEAREQRSKFSRLALAPTMGALHAGHLSHADAMDQITLLAKEVLPRVQRPASSKRAA